MIADETFHQEETYLINSMINWEKKGQHRSYPVINDVSSFKLSICKVQITF